MSDIYYFFGAPTWHPGLYCCYQSLVGFLDFCEQDPPVGYKVFFERGLYLDTSVGLNWWEYYFEPIESGTPGEKTEHISDVMKSKWGTDAISTISRERASEIIHRYIKPKKHIQDKIDLFIKNEFKDNYIIGVHFRGLDKSSEAPRVPYEVFRDKIQEVIGTRTNYRIFVATDEQLFLDYIVKCFGGRITYTLSRRSKDHEPIHHIHGEQVENRYALGEEAVIDCYLLAQTDILIRNQSNLSSSAANINPKLPVIDLNKALYRPGLR